jgi:hypothetical protein
MDPRDPSQRIADNPFHVLGLGPDCSRAEVEREGQKLLGMLELGLSAARSYDTPLGKRERTSDKVRQAMAELRDPERRLGHELWARTQGGQESATLADERGAPGWRGALTILGWKRRGAGA